jgi:hypothetical protein
MTVRTLQAACSHLTGSGLGVSGQGPCPTAYADGLHSAADSLRPPMQTTVCECLIDLQKSGHHRRGQRDADKGQESLRVSTMPPRFRARQDRGLQYPLRKAARRCKLPVPSQRYQRFRFEAGFSASPASGKSAGAGHRAIALTTASGGGMKRREPSQAPCPFW